jgi:hypothetical protein
MDDDEHKIPHVDIESRGNITGEQFEAFAKESTAILTMRVLNGEWTVIIDQEFMEALRRFDPLKQMRISTIIIEGVRKAMQAITDQQ